MRTIFIGDIHGCAAEFDHLLEHLQYEPDQDRLLLTGDAFTRGPDPLRVWERIQATQAEMVMGNHDERLLKHLRRIQNGNIEPGNNPDRQRTLDLLQPVAKQLLPWLKALPLWIEDSNFLLVHAGIHPQDGLQGTSRDEFLTIRTWPPVTEFSAPRWHDVYKPDRPLIIFGHDAPGGLVIKRRKDGTPYVIGLDSGCVYGNQLSAYILEEDRIAQVNSEFRWQRSES